MLTEEVPRFEYYYTNNVKNGLRTQTSSQVVFHTPLFYYRQLESLDCGAKSFSEGVRGTEECKICCKVMYTFSVYGLTNGVFLGLSK